MSDENSCKEMIVKVVIPGEEKWSDLEEELLKVALHELNHGKLRELGILIKRTCDTYDGKGVIFSYPLDIKMRMDRISDWKELYSVNEETKKESKSVCGISDRDYIRLLEKLVTKYSGKSLGQCVLESINE